MSQMKLAARAGLDPSYVGGIERGERNPSIDAVAQLASALEVEPGELMAFGGPVRASSAELAELVTLLQKEKPSETRKVLAVAKIMLGHSAP